MPVLYRRSAVPKVKLYIFIRIKLQCLSVTTAQNKAALLNTQFVSAGNIP